MKQLTGTIKIDFENWLSSNKARWAYKLSPLKFRSAFFVLFMAETNLVLDIQYWDRDGFDWAITKGWKDEVLISKRNAGNRFKTYPDAVLDSARTITSIYNNTPNLCRK